MHHYRVRAPWKPLPAALLVLLLCGPALAQVSPAEILNPRLKAAEAKYLPQIESLHQAIATTKFPFPFTLARYVQSDPNKKQDSFDTRGIEFVYFHNRVVLKTSGIYGVAYSAERMTQNERAAKTFQDVILPILRLVARQIPRDVDCDDIGFEIVYHTRAAGNNYDYEGKEIIAATFSKDDAFAAADATDNQQLQDILNRSQIFVDGKEFGLALGARDPLDVEALARSVPVQAVTSAPATASTSSSTSASMNIALASPAKPGVAPAKNLPKETETAPAASPTAPAPSATSSSASTSKPAPTEADAEQLQSQVQPQLDAFVKSSGQEFNLVDYAPPSLAVYHGEIVLQLTLRDPREFDANTSSIYRRAAQSFDLFLAPKLKSILRKLPASEKIQAFDFSVLHRLGVGTSSAEAVEYICPAEALRLFTADEITTQDLIDRSVVLVNGVRITLNLQAVE